MRCTDAKLQSTLSDLCGTFVCITLCCSMRNFIVFHLLIDVFDVYFAVWVTWWMMVHTQPETCLFIHNGMVDRKCTYIYVYTIQYMLLHCLLRLLNILFFCRFYDIQCARVLAHTLFIPFRLHACVCGVRNSAKNSLRLLFCYTSILYFIHCIDLFYVPTFTIIEWKKNVLATKVQFYCCESNWCSWLAAIGSSGGIFLCVYCCWQFGSR